jgi:hypothetical protein
MDLGPELGAASRLVSYSVKKTLSFVYVREHTQGIQATAWRVVRKGDRGEIEGEFFPFHAKSIVACAAFCRTTLTLIPLPAVKTGAGPLLLAFSNNVHLD